MGNGARIDYYKKKNEIHKAKLKSDPVYREKARESRRKSYRTMKSKQICPYLKAFRHCTHRDNWEYCGSVPKCKYEDKNKVKCEYYRDWLIKLKKATLHPLKRELGVL